MRSIIVEDIIVAPSLEIARFLESLLLSGGDKQIEKNAGKYVNQPEGFLNNVQVVCSAFSVSKTKRPNGACLVMGRLVVTGAHRSWCMSSIRPDYGFS